MTDLLEASPYSVASADKKRLLLRGLQELTVYHQQNCLAYHQLFNEPVEPFTDISAVPFLTVPLFKQRPLKSIPVEQVFKVLTSSGTTGTVPSRIYLDADTAKLQSRVLVKIMQEWLGKQRLPMLIWDSPSVIKSRDSFTARGAGIQGLSFLGRHHTYALNDDMSLNIEAINTFFERFGSGPVFMFGFTFMVWKFGVQALKEQGLKFDFQNAVLIHSGGWKKLEDEAVTAETFNSKTEDQLGHVRVHNFYGMVEQVGSIFVACEEGHLHCPSYADVLVREPGNWQVVPEGNVGVLQVLSLLPKSYPGHSLLTEDRGRILGEDNCNCGRKGKYFEVLGRMEKVEARGCSDTFERTGAGQ
ncbi:acyl-protein synthetase [Aliidiomarina taiwanensis]|uniref:Acyl-protein synthetase n=1 Tax=Aliidiomarina taiwanensis TaxID=946228 RepID=A0A432XAS5_9GAMM|nr:acyl-protein synthetase [Aliidiomarina taiwanensis]